MRAFIAVELPEPVRAAMRMLQAPLRRSGADVTWVGPEQWHVTLRFLGDIDARQREAIESLLRSVASRHGPLEARLDRLGAFPSLRSPRVLWVGLSVGQPALARMAADIDAELAAVGIAAETRPFVGHVTLGRVRSTRRKARLLAEVEALTWQAPAPFVVNALTLFHSALSSTGPTYTPLARVSLLGARPAA